MTWAADKGAPPLSISAPAISHDCPSEPTASTDRDTSLNAMSSDWSYPKRLVTSVPALPPTRLPVGPKRVDSVPGWMAHARTNSFDELTAIPVAKVAPPNPNDVR